MSQVKFHTKLTSFHREVAQAGGTYAAGIAEAYGRKFAQEKSGKAGNHISAAANC
jgi:hypothetical protein